MLRPFSMCSEEECQNRQSSMEVSIWEATYDTWNKPSKERIMDPCLAVSKYRRSAAGTQQRSPRRIEQLWDTWEHLRSIFIHQKVHDNQPPRTLASTALFVEDRIRAIQVDLVVSRKASQVLQLQFVRFHIISLYLLAGIPRTIYESKFSKLALRTALAVYWNDEEGHRSNDNDDSVLCYTTLCHVAATLTDSSWVDMEMALETYRQHADNIIYPKFSKALQIATAIHVQNYYLALRLLNQKTTSVMCRLCMAPCLNRLRWLCLSHYNKAFMKCEKLMAEEVSRLLFLPNARAALDFVKAAGFPVQDGEVVVFKAAPIQELKSYDANRSVDDKFHFCEIESDRENRVDLDHVTIPSHDFLLQLIVDG